MTTADRDTQLASYLSTARWYAGKGRAVEVHGVRRLQVTGSGSPHVATELVEVTAADGHGTDLYQVPLSFYAEPREDLAHALVGSWTDDELGPVHAYDAVHDHHAMALWLRGFVEGADAGPGGVVFKVVGSPDLDPEGRAFAYQREDWARLAVSYAETGQLIHPRHERRERTMNDLPEVPSAYAESTPFIRAAETGGAMMPIPDDPGVFDAPPIPDPPEGGPAPRRNSSARRRLASGSRAAK